MLESDLVSSQILLVVGLYLALESNKLCCLIQMCSHISNLMPEGDDLGLHSIDLLLVCKLLHLLHALAHVRPIDKRPIVSVVYLILRGAIKHRSCISISIFPGEVLLDVSHGHISVPFLVSFPLIIVLIFEDLILSLKGAELFLHFLHFSGCSDLLSFPFLALSVEPCEDCFQPGSLLGDRLTFLWVLKEWRCCQGSDELLGRILLCLDTGQLVS